jgi:hypothetical protein
MLLVFTKEVEQTKEKILIRVEQRKKEWEDKNKML